MILTNIVVLVTAIGAMVVLSWQLTALSLALMPLFIWLTDRVGRARRAVGTSTQQAMAELSALSEETLSVSGVLLSRSFGRQREEIARFRELNVDLGQLQVRQQMIGQVAFMSLRLFFSLR